MKKRDTALVPYKTCPRCDGAGRVPCSGREYWHQLAREWADSLHGRMVMVPFYKGHDKWTQVPGLAVRAKFPGGWHGVKVYISIDNSPNWGGNGISLDYDIINGHKLYYLYKGRPDRTKVIPIDIKDVPPEFKKVVMQLLQPGSQRRAET